MPSVGGGRAGRAASPLLHQTSGSGSWPSVRHTGFKTVHGLLRGLSSPGSPTASGQPSRMSALQEWRRRRLARLACCPARLLLARLPLPRIFSGSLGSACPAVEAHASPTGHRHWEHKPRPPGEEGTEASSQGTGSREPGFPAAFHGGWDPSAENFACHRQCGCAGS